MLKTPGWGQKTIRELEHYLKEVELGAPGQPSHSTPATLVKRSEQDSGKAYETGPTLIHMCSWLGLDADADISAPG